MELIAPLLAQMVRMVKRASKNVTVPRELYVIRELGHVSALLECTD